MTSYGGSPNIRTKALYVLAEGFRKVSVIVSSSQVMGPFREATVSNFPLFGCKCAY